MKKLIIALIIGAFIMGLFDGGDVTGAVVLAFLLSPVIFERKEKTQYGKSKRSCHQ